MTERFVTHDTMQLERTYRAAPDRVFAAWADRGAKARWFAGAAADAAVPGGYELDFRIGGREFIQNAAPDGAVYTYEARYDDIVANERIVFTYFMLRDDTRISVSVASVELRPDGDGTRLVLTEHGIYLDGEDKPEFRTEGVEQQLIALNTYLE